MDAAGRSRLIGLITGITLAFSLMHTTWFPWAPAALVAPLVIGFLIGELTLPRPARTAGAAALRTRQVRDYLPRGAALATATAVLALLASLLVPPTTPSDYVLWYYPGNDPVQLATSSLASIAVVLVVAALALWAIVRSRATGVTEEQQRLDDAWRRRTAEAITNLTATLTALAAAACLLWLAHGTFDWRRGGAQPLLGFPLTAVGVAALALFAWYAQRLVRATEEQS